MWTQAGRSIVLAIIACLMVVLGENFGLHDIYFLGLAQLDSLIEFLQHHPKGVAIANRFLKSKADQTREGILINLTAALEELYPAAVNQYHTPKDRWFSLKDFIEGEGVLLIGLDPQARETSAPLMRVMFSRLVELISIQVDNSFLPRHQRQKIFTFIDEMRFVGRLRNLDELFSFCPSKGASTYVSCQSVDQLYQLYGKEEAESILGNCVFKLFFRPGTSASKRLIMDTMGQHRMTDIKYSRSYSAKGGISFTESREEVIRDLIPSGELMKMLPLASYESGIRFFVDTPIQNVDLFYKVISGRKVASLQPDESSDVDAFIQKPPHMLQFPKVSEEEWMYFLQETFSRQDIYEKFMAASSHEPEWMQEIKKNVFDMMEVFLADYIEDYLRYRYKMD